VNGLNDREEMTMDERAPHDPSESTATPLRRWETPVLRPIPVDDETSHKGTPVPFEVTTSYLRMGS
jgi:hypothetical protein